MCPLLFYCSHNVNTFYSHLFQQILRCPGISCADGFFPNQRTINILIIQCVLIIIHRIYKIFENVLDLLILCLTSLCTCKCLLCCIFNLLLSGFSLLLCADIRWMKLCIIFVYRHFRTPVTPEQFWSVVHQIFVYLSSLIVLACMKKNCLLHGTNPLQDLTINLFFLFRQLLIIKTICNVFF